MGDLNIAATSRPRITITGLDGVEHPYEVLPFTKAQMDGQIKYQKAAREIQERVGEHGDADAADVSAIQDLMADTIDARVRSLNGGTTIRELWNEGLIEFKHLRVIGEYLQREAQGDPPV